MSDQRTCLHIFSQQIMDIAIIPVLKGLISDIVPSLLNTDIFGYYYVTKMIITGSLLDQKEQNGIYNCILRSEIVKEFKEQMISRIYNFQVIIALNTRYQLSTSKGSNKINKVSSLYDIFWRGELRIVASVTFWYDGDPSANFFIHQDHEICSERVTIQLYNGENMSKLKYTLL